MYGYFFSAAVVLHREKKKKKKKKKELHSSARKLAKSFSCMKLQIKEIT